MNRISGKNFEKMMIEAIQKDYSLFAWQSLGGVIEKCELKIQHFRKDYNIMELELASPLINNLDKIISGDRKINVYVPSLSVSFSSELKSVTTENRLKISIPTEYAFYERRKHERVQPLKTCYVTFELNRVTQRKNIFDISQGGIAIILPKSKRMAMDNCNDYFELTLDIHGVKIKAEAQCVGSMIIDAYRSENLPYGGYKVAFRFSKMSIEDREFIKNFINLQTINQVPYKKVT